MGRVEGAIVGIKWWEAVVRVESDSGFGTGVLISPRTVLTAAHVLVSHPGGPLPAQVRVLRVHGAQAWLGVESFTVSPKWLSNAADALGHDLAAIRLKSSESIHLVPEPSRVALGTPFDGAAYDTAKSAAPEALEWIDLWCGRPRGVTGFVVKFSEAPTSPNWFEEVICKSAEPTTSSPEVEVRKRQIEPLKRQCQDLRPVAFPAAAPLLASVVGGLGDFLKDRAKKELIAYAVETLGRELCRKDGKVRKALVVDGLFVLAKSCDVAFPSGDELDYTAVADGRFQRVFQKELEALPVKLAIIALEKARGAKINGVQRALITSLYEELSPLLRGVAVDTGGILGRYDDNLKSQLAEDKSLTCQVDWTKGLDPSCMTLLGIRVAATAERSIASQPSMLDLKKLLKEAGESFCRDYGPNDKASLTCLGVSDTELSALLIKVNSWASNRTTGQLLATLDLPPDTKDSKELLRDMLAIAEHVHTGIKTLKQVGPNTSDEKKRELIVAALREMVIPTLRFAQKVSNLDPVLFGALELAFDAALALAAQDFDTLRATLKTVIALPRVREVLGERGVRAVQFGLDIGSVKNADEAKKVFETMAEPLGSYRAKYDATFTLALDGIVGVQLGAVRRINLNYRGKDHDTWGFDPKPLSAPVGLDFSWRQDRQHIGLLVSALDPLGMVVLEEKSEEAVRVDWGAVVTPGAFFRWGIQRSPIVAFVGAQYLPLRRPEPETKQVFGQAKSVVGYDGGFTFGGGLAVDVPILFVVER